MPYKKITVPLIDGEILLLDGGTGSELQRRGVNVLKDATDKFEAWSATSNIDNPDVAQQAHQDYLRVGADIITSNNFWTTPTAMDRIGLHNEWKNTLLQLYETQSKPEILAIQRLFPPLCPD